MLGEKELVGKGYISVVFSTSVGEFLIIGDILKNLRVL